MFKKISLLIAALCISTPAIAKPQFNGRVIAMGKMVSEYTVSTSSVTYGCYDDTIGYFDTCIDVSIITAQSKPKVYMDVTINKSLGAERPNILVRYSIMLAQEASVYMGAASVYSRLSNTKLTNKYGHNFIQYDKNTTSTVYQTSNDGGESWSEIKVLSN